MEQGQNFDKIEFELFGLELLEPMAIFWNLALAVSSFFFCFKLRAIPTGKSYKKLWQYFFLVFGLASFTGAVGHAFYNYLGLYGKILPWSFTIIAVALAEISLSTLLKHGLFRQIMLAVSLVKLLVFAVITTIEQSFIPVTINTITGFMLIVVPLSIAHQKNLDRHFRYFWIGVICLVPAAFFFLLKLNMHKWFNKDDASHLFILICLFFFYTGIKNTYSSAKRR